MRKLLLPLLVALLALGAIAGPAQALNLPLLTTVADEEGDEVEAADESGSEASDDCVIEDEEDALLCAEIAAEEREEAEAEEWVLEDATARVSANPANDTVEVTIHYRASTPAPVKIDAKLRGSKGKLHLGASRTHFRRTGTFHNSFGLGERPMEKVLAAREFTIEVQALDTPLYCRLHLTAHRGGTRKKLWS